jgi:hypothetical protein
MPTLPFTTLENKAWNFAEKNHSGIFRKFSKSTYFDGHVAKVYGILKQYDTRPTLGAACLMHDLLEDTNVTYDMIKQKFGIEIANLVKELTSNDEEVLKQGKANYLLYKMSRMSDDALIIKLCDRLQNMSDMYVASNTFRNKYYTETKFIIDSLKNSRRLNHKHNRIISQIDALLLNIRKRNKFESLSDLRHIQLFEDFKQNNISIDDIIKCIDSGGVIYTDIIKNYPKNDSNSPIKPVSVDNDGSITVDVNGDIYEVDIKNVCKIEYDKK